MVAIGDLRSAGSSSSPSQKALAARRSPVRTGWEELIGSEGDVRLPLDAGRPGLRPGSALARDLAPGAGEADAGRARERGDRVRVEAVEGLTLIVRPLADEANEAEE